MRALTVDEIALLREGNQSSRLRLAISNPAIVFKCRINQSFSTLSQVTEFEYDGVTAGAFGDVLPHQTVLIGSTEGAFDVGICRVRKALDSNTFYIGETSEIVFADNLYVTVLEDFGIWSRPSITVGNGDTRMDFDVEFPQALGASQPPIVRMGPAAFVLSLVDDLATLEPDGSQTYSPAGLEIAVYEWTCTGASASSGTSTATPEFEFDAAGEYLLQLRVEDSEGNESTGYRKVLVDPSSPEFRLTADLSADLSSGGWAFEVEAWADIRPEDVHDKTLVVLWARNFYGDEEISIGPVEGQEHVLAIGWVYGKSIGWNADFSRVSFRVEGAQYWMNAIDNRPASLLHTAAGAFSWTEIHALTVDQGLAQLLYWRSTVAWMMDCYFTDSALELPLLDAPGNSIWEQIRSMAYNTLKAQPLVNRYGQLYVEIPIQIRPLTAQDVIVEETGMFVNGDWTVEAHASHSDGAAKWTDELDTSTSYIFFGQAVKVYGKKGSDQGEWEVLVDGVVVATVDAYAAATAYQQLMHTESGLSKGLHTVTINCPHTKNASSSDYRVTVDFIAYTNFNDRSFPTLMEIERQDWRDELLFDVRSTPEVSFLEVAGLADYDGANIEALFSHAPGETSKHHGTLLASESDMIFADQDDCNEKASMLLDWMNNEFPSVAVPLASFFGMGDICPQHYLTMSIEAADTPLGIVWSAQNVIPVRVTHLFDVEAQAFRTEIEVEMEPELTDLAVTYIPPTPPATNIGLGYELPSFEFPDLPMPDVWFPPLVPELDLPDCDDEEDNGPFFLNFSPSHIVGDDEKNVAKAYCPCMVRNGTFIRFTGLRLGGDAPAHITVTAIDGAGATVLTAVYSGGVATFSPVSPTEVAGFAFTLDVGGTGTDYRVLDGVVASGVVDADDGVGDAVELPTGLWAFESYGGPFDSGSRSGLGVGEGSASDTGQGLKWTWQLEAPTGGWEGILGRDAYGDMRLEGAGAAPGIVACFSISAFHARAYVEVVTPYTTHFRVQDNAIALTTFPYANNSGQLGWLLRAAYLNDREAWLKPSELYNVCAIA